jgi:hypothetical protein
MVAGWADSVVAVGGTLGAVVITAMLRERNDKVHRAEEDRRAKEDNAVNMVATFSKVIAAHRTAMWTRHQTRGDVELPLTALQMRVPSLRDAAQKLADVTFAMHEGRDIEDLKARRRAAVAAAKEFKAIAGTQFAEAGIGLELGSATRPITTSARRRVLRAAIRFFGQEEHGMPHPRRNPEARA